MIKTISDEIKIKLKQSITDVEVANYPQKFDRFLKEFIHPKGAILVTYKGSTFSKPQTTDIVIQEESVSFALIVLIRAFTDDEALIYLDKIKKSLTGFKIAGCSKIWVERTEFLDEDEGIFMYEVDFTTKTKSFEVTE